MPKAKTKAKSEREYTVIVSFRIDGIGAWSVGDPLKDGDIPAENIKTLLADGDIEVAE